jgi:hypothetical protein
MMIFLKITHCHELLQINCPVLLFTIFSLLTEIFFDRPFSGHGQDHDHDGVRVVGVRDCIVRVLRDAVQVDVVVVVVIIVDVVVRVSDRVERQHHERQKVEAVKSFFNN